MTFGKKRKGNDWLAPNQSLHRTMYYISDLFSSQSYFQSVEKTPLFSALGAMNDSTLCREFGWSPFMTYAMLKESRQVFASKYKTVQPTEKELAEELAREKRMLEAGGGVV